MIEWYRNGEFYEDDSPEEPEQNIKIGDHIKMRNHDMAFYKDGNFRNSGMNNGDTMGKVTKIKNIDGVNCVFANGPEQWYKMECVEVVNEKDWW